MISSRWPHGKSVVQQKRMLEWVKKVGADLGQLDILVEDIKCQQANVINSRGLESQLSYLLKMRGEEETRRMIWHEIQLLRRYGMKAQSKVVPVKNRRIK